MFKRRKPLLFRTIAREWIWPRAGWQRVMRYLWQRLVRLNDGPRKIALGLACGAFVSATPFLGVHVILAICLAWLLRANLIASAFGTLIGNPLTFPFIWIITYRFGNVLLGRYPVSAEEPELTMSLFLQAPIDNFIPVFLPLIVGSLPLGLILAVGSYFPTLWAIYIYKKKIIRAVPKHPYFQRHKR